MKTLEQQQCQFCHKVGLQFCHGHYHCTHCGSANFECCTNEKEQHDVDNLSSNNISGDPH